MNQYHQGQHNFFYSSLTHSLDPPRIYHPTLIPDPPTIPRHRAGRVIGLPFEYLSAESGGWRSPLPEIRLLDPNLDELRPRNLRNLSPSPNPRPIVHGYNVAFSGRKRKDLVKEEGERRLYKRAKNSGKEHGGGRRNGRKVDRGRESRTNNYHDERGAGNDIIIFDDSDDSSESDEEHDHSDDNDCDREGNEEEDNEDGEHYDDDKKDGKAGRRKVERFTNQKKSKKYTTVRVFHSQSNLHGSQVQKRLQLSPPPPLPQDVLTVLEKRLGQYDTSVRVASQALSIEDRPQTNASPQEHRHNLSLKRTFAHDDEPNLPDCVSPLAVTTGCPAWTSDPVRYWPQVPHEEVVNEQHDDGQADREAEELRFPIKSPEVNDNFDTEESGEVHNSPSNPDKSISDDSNTDSSRRPTGVQQCVCKFAGNEGHDCDIQRDYGEGKKAGYANGYKFGHNDRRQEAIQEMLRVIRDMGRDERYDNGFDAGYEAAVAHTFRQLDNDLNN